MTAVVREGARVTHFLIEAFVVLVDVGRQRTSTLVKKPSVITVGLHDRYLEISRFRGQCEVSETITRADSVASQEQLVRASQFG